jgi:hypothetical protein
MSEDQHNRVTLAIEQLHVAIDLFLKNTSDASAVTLAGAADEVLARKATRFGQPQAIETKHEVLTLLLKRVGRAPRPLAALRKEENSVRNLLKHLDPNEDENFTSNLGAEAVRRINSACNNYERCGLPVTEKMAEFRGWYLSESPRPTPGVA